MVSSEIKSFDTDTTILNIFTKPKDISTEAELIPKKQKLKSNEIEEVDSCMSWLVLFVSLCGTAVVGCSYSLFSLLYNDFVVEFETNTATAGWIGSMHVGCGNIAAVFLGVAVEKLGCRFVCMLGSLLASLGYFLTFFANHIAFAYLSYGILAGIGVGMVSMGSVIATQQCFNQKRAFAGAVVTVGYSIGVIVSGLVMRYYYAHSTWRGVCVLFAGISLQMVVLSAFAFTPANLPSVHKKPQSSKPTPLEYIKVACEPAVLMFLLANFVVHIGVNTLYQHGPNRALSIGIVPSLVALYPMTSALANVVGKIGGGVIANQARVNRLVFYSISVLLSGITQTLMPLCIDFTSIVIQGIVQNFFNGIFICVLTTIMVDLKGVNEIAKTQALLALFVGTGVLISTPAAGFLYDITQNYDVTFIVTGVITMLGTILGILSNYFQKKNEKLINL